MFSNILVAYDGSPPEARSQSDRAAHQCCHLIRAGGAATVHPPAGPRVRHRVGVVSAVFASGWFFLPALLSGPLAGALSLVYLVDSSDINSATAGVS
jgi:hypothetical protein